MKKFSVFNFQFSKQKGFTLIELLVVLGIFVTVGSVIVSLLFISFRGSTKSEVATTVKQNGDFALSQIVKQVRFARSIENPASCYPEINTPSITVTSLSDGGQTTFSCPTSPVLPISSNSAALLDSNAVNVTYCSFTCSQNSDIDPPRITIDFKLKAKNAGGLIEAESAMPFQSSVIMRNVAP